MPETEIERLVRLATPRKQEQRMQTIPLHVALEARTLYIFKRLCEAMTQAGYHDGTWDIDEEDGNVVIDGLKIGRADVVMDMSALEIISAIQTQEE